MAESAHPAFASRFSVEATRPTIGEIEQLAGILPAGTEVYITAVPKLTIDELITAAVGLRRAGLEPVPHIAARMLPDAQTLSDVLAHFAGEADVRRLLVIGGDAPQVGPFPDALSVIQKGRLHEIGIEEIGIGAYPEGHPTIPPERIEGALDAKIAAAVAQGLAVNITSQFSFSPERILSWLKQLRACGIERPVKVGMVGPTSVPGLMRFARRCGVSMSVRGLVSGNAAALIGHVNPDRIVEALSAAEGIGNVAPHYFSFGGTIETARYGCAAAQRTGQLARAMASPDQA
jgi:methylenetetrahydrofolate reductase (NADPH)